MQMQRKGAYHHTMIRTEVQMVCEHWVVMWKTRTRACITWVLAEFASTLYLASAWFQKIIQVHIISDEWSDTWWELCFLQNISPQWSDRHQCPRNMVWCICFTRFRSILFSLTWHGLLVYIYIYSPTVGAGIDERGVILAISTTRLPHFTLHRRHQDWKRGYAALRAVCLSKHVAHEGKEYNGGDTHYSPRDPRLWPLFRIEYWSISDCAPRRILR